MGFFILEKMISTNISTVQFQDEKKEPKPTMDAMLIWSLCEEEEQLDMLSSKQNPGETETRVGWFWETININKEHEKHLKLLKVKLTNELNTGSLLHFMKIV